MNVSDKQSQGMMEERKAAGIDRDLAVNEMIAGIQGSENIAEMNYNGYNF